VAHLPSGPLLCRMRDARACVCVCVCGAVKRLRLLRLIHHAQSTDGKRKYQDELYAELLLRRMGECSMKDIGVSEPAQKVQRVSCTVFVCVGSPARS
jgi:hypothetical protein